MGFVKKAAKAVTKPFKSIGREIERGVSKVGDLGSDIVEGVGDVLSPSIEIPEVDTSGQEAAARQAAQAQRQAAEQAAQNARWQAEAAAQQFASQTQRDQLRQAAMEQSTQDLDAGGEADVDLGDASDAESATRRRQFQSAGRSRSPSIRI